jgi:hypothetical protein
MFVLRVGLLLIAGMCGGGGAEFGVCLAACCLLVPANVTMSCRRNTGRLATSLGWCV